MKLATIRYQDNVHAGLVKDGNFYSFQGIDERLPNDMINMRIADPLLRKSWSRPRRHAASMRQSFCRRFQDRGRSETL